MKLSANALRLLKDDFVDLADTGMIQQWPELIIKWLHQNHAGGRKLDDGYIVYNRLIFRDKAVLESILKDEYANRRIPNQFDIDWDKYKQIENH